MSRIDFWCSRPAYIEHAAPLWHALPESLRGKFYTVPELFAYSRSLGINPKLQLQKVYNDSVLILSRMEYRRLPHSYQHIAFLEHGVGASYNGVSHLPFREEIELILTTPAQKKAHRAVYGNRVKVVGCPKLDEWRKFKKPHNIRPVVAFSHHWDQHTYPETRSAWPWDEAAWSEIIASEEYEILGHKHPGDKRDIARWCALQGIQFTSKWHDVMETADVYVCDNSSTLYEFAATGRPVVCLNPPWYRREVEHGFRFWSHIPGIECDDPLHLHETIALALTDSVELQAQRKAAIKAAYGPLNGKATARATDEIVKWLSNLQS